MLPELDVFDADGHQFVHPERVTPHHEDLLFMTPEGKQDTPIYRPHFLSLSELRADWLRLKTSVWSPGQRGSFITAADCSFEQMFYLLGTKSEYFKKKLVY